MSTTNGIVFVSSKMYIFQVLETAQKAKHCRSDLPHEISPQDRTVASMQYPLGREGI